MTHSASPVPEGNQYCPTQPCKTKRGVNISLLKTPVHVSNTDYEDKTAPELGEDTNIVLEEIGFTKDQIISFKNKGVI